MSYFQDNRALFVEWVDSFACPDCLGNGALASRQDDVVKMRLKVNRVHVKCSLCRGRGTLVDFSAVAEAIKATKP